MGDNIKSRECLSGARLAEQGDGEAAVLVKSSRVDLADSALHAPTASFGGEEFSPDIFDKAAVLVCRLSWNHPLIDGSRLRPATGPPPDPSVRASARSPDDGDGGGGRLVRGECGVVGGIAGERVRGREVIDHRQAVRIAHYLDV